MEPIELVNQIRCLYLKAREITSIKKNIRRGRSRSIASEVEDLFAIYLSELLPDNYNLLVDQPISYFSNGNNFTLYPDVAIIKENDLVSIFDIKMDLGWNRNFGPYCAEKCQLIEDIRGKTAKLKDGITKIQQDINILSTIKYNVVIISNLNISKNKREDNFKKINELDKGKIKVYVLTDNVHPNSYDNIEISDISIKQNFFTELKNELDDIKKSKN